MRWEIQGSNQLDACIFLLSASHPCASSPIWFLTIKSVALSSRKWGSRMSRSEPVVSLLLFLHSLRDFVKNKRSKVIRFCMDPVMKTGWQREKERGGVRREREKKGERACPLFLRRSLPPQIDGLKLSSESENLSLEFYQLEEGESVLNPDPSLESWQYLAKP